MKSKWITHRETRILHADISNFDRNLDDLKAELDELTALVCQEPLNSMVMLIDLQNTVLSVEAVRILKEDVPKMGPHISTRAIVVTKIGVKKVILGGIARLLKGQVPMLFEDIETAKDWLVDNR